MTSEGLGLRDDAVILSAHNPNWALLFIEESRAIRSALGSSLVGIEHVGSTAIPGISAKPILDVLVGVGDFEAHEELERRLAAIGYTFRPASGLPAELVFVKGTPRTHILHAVVWNGDAWRQKLAFRDALRANRALALEYDALKSRLALDFADDRAAYTSGKGDFVRRVVEASAPDTPFLTRG